MDLLQLEIMRITRERYRLALFSRTGASETLSTAQQLLNVAEAYHAECQREYELAKTALVETMVPPEAA